MQFEQGKSGLPIGKTQELETSKDTLPAIEVANKVLWVNPDLDYPFFHIEEGKPTNLGMFLSHQSVRVEDRTEIKMHVETETYHGRSALLGRVIFGEKKKEGLPRQLFRDVDIKGLGYVNYFHSHRPYVSDIELNEDEISSNGILSLKDAQKDVAMAETFRDFGIRTNRAIAIVALEEVVYDGKKISIAKAKAKGLIAASVVPVLEIRAFGTHLRLIDAMGGGFDPPPKSVTKKELSIEDARLLVAQELGENPNNFNNFKYATWLAKIIGKNLGLMHKHGYIHKYLRQGHNITLDGCIVDFDSVEPIGVESDDNFSKFNDDYREARTALKNLLLQVPQLHSTDIEFQQILEEFQTSYQEIRQKVVDDKLL